VCPKIVGQLLAVVLQGGQARQNRDTPAGPLPGPGLARSPVGTELGSVRERIPGCGGTLADILRMKAVAVIREAIGYGDARGAQRKPSVAAEDVPAMQMPK